MNCYIRYIFRSLAMPVLLITVSLTGIVWLTQSLRFIDLIVNRGLELSSFLYLSSLLLPSLVSVILPIALFCSVIFVYNKLTHDSELIVLKSAGLSRFMLAKPALMFAAIIVLVGYIISLYVLPASYREFKDMQVFIRDNYVSLLLQKGVFNSPVSGLTVYIEDRNEDNMLLGILVHDNRNPDKPVTMMAQQGKLIKTPAGPRFSLLNGNRQEVNVENGQLSLLYFDRYMLDLSIFNEEQGARVLDPKERYLGELFFPERVDAYQKGRLYAEGHRRLTWPLYNLVLPIIALTALLTGQFNRRGQWKRIVAATTAAVVFMGLGMIFTNIASQIPLFAIAIYLNIACVLVGCGYFLFESHYFQALRSRTKYKGRRLV